MICHKVIQYEIRKEELAAKLGIKGKVNTVRNWGNWIYLEVEDVKQ